MIKLIYEQKEEYFDDITFPKRNCEVIINDDDTVLNLFFELVQLAQYAGYAVTNKTWDDIKNYINDNGGFVRCDYEEEETIEEDEDELEEDGLPFI